MIKTLPDLSKRVFAMKIPRPIPSYSGLASNNSEVFRLLTKGSPITPNISRGNPFPSSVILIIMLALDQFASIHTFFDEKSTAFCIKFLNPCIICGDLNTIGSSFFVSSCSSLKNVKFICFPSVCVWFSGLSDQFGNGCVS